MEDVLFVLVTVMVERKGDVARCTRRRRKCLSRAFPASLL